MPDPPPIRTNGPLPIVKPATNTHPAAHADAAAREASFGALRGALKWGALSAVAGVGAYFASPMFRSLTIQFRVYLWMCPTTLGSMMEADNQLRRYERVVRLENQMQWERAREKAVLEEMREVERMEREVGGRW